MSIKVILCPLLFSLAEEVFSRGISKLVNDNKILHMASSQGYLTLIFYMLMTYLFFVGGILSLLEI